MGLEKLKLAAIEFYRGEIDHLQVARVIAFEVGREPIEGTVTDLVKSYLVKYSIDIDKKVVRNTSERFRAISFDRQTLNIRNGLLLHELTSIVELLSPEDKVLCMRMVRENTRVSGVYST